MNETLQNILSRCSTRSYRTEQIDDKDLTLILQAGLYAASGHNCQETKLVVLQDKAAIACLSKMNAAILGTKSDPFYGAPTVVIVLAEASCRTGYADGSLVIGNMMLAAHSLGLGSCWINRADEEFSSDAGRKLLHSWQIEGDYIGVGHCILGYPTNQAQQEKPRKDGRITFIR